MDDPSYPRMFPRGNFLSNGGQHWEGRHKDHIDVYGRVYERVMEEFVREIPYYDVLFPSMMHGAFRDFLFKPGQSENLICSDLS